MMHQPSTSVLDEARTHTHPSLTAGSPVHASAWAAEHREEIRTLVGERGWIVVSGLELGDADDAAAVARHVIDRPVHEVEAFAPRTVLGDGLYASTPWPANQPMCMHHELSYRLEVPGLLLFACVAAPTAGGAIGLPDSTAVLAGLPAELVGRFEREGWMLTRTYTDEIGASVREAFGTDDRAVVARYCRDNAIDAEWQRDGVLRTRQRRSAVVRHPLSGLSCWFNQIAFLNEWTMSADVREYLVDEYGVDGLPFNTRFGNGDPIGADVVQLINEVYDANTVWQPLHAGDLIVVDNIRMAHSREPYEGPREVVVAMGDPVSLAEGSTTRKEAGR